MPVNQKHLTRVLCVAVLATVAACGDNVSPKAVRQTPAPQFSPTIFDGAHGGNKSVFFLPPMVSNPSGQPGFGDPVQAGLPVSFKIVRLASSVQGCTSQDTKTFSTTDVTFSGDHYQANWHTDDSNLLSQCTYRIEVLVGNQIEAFADVDVVDSGNQLKRVDTQEFVPLLDGRTLPINVRVETGVRFCTDPNCVSVIVPQNVQTLVVTPDGENAALFSPGWFSVSQFGTDQVIVTIQDITGSPDIAKTGCGLGVTKMVTPSTTAAPVHCVRFNTDPQITSTTAQVVVAVCQENRGDIPQLLLKYDLNEAPTFLRNVPAPIDCPEQIGSTSPLGRAVHYAMSRVGHAAQAIFGPKVAYAFDLGVGGSMDGGGFSVIAAGTPLQMTAVSDTTPSAQAGNTVDGAPSIQLRYLHRPSENTPAGPNDASVTCTVSGSNGHLIVGDQDALQGQAFHSSDDPNGVYHCPAWRLDSGDNFVVVTSNVTDAVIRVGGLTGAFAGTVQFHGTGTAVIP